MGPTDSVLRLIEVLNEVGVPYMLVGSYSSNYYGKPRSTKDADFVVQIEHEQLGRVASRLGTQFQFDNQMSFETVTMTTRYIIRIPDIVFKIEMFLLSPEAHDQSRFARRKQLDFEGRLVWLPTPEDVIITKLRWSKGGAREKDVDDVRRVLALQVGKLDLPYIHEWTEKHGTRELFDQLLRATSE